MLGKSEIKSYLRNNTDFRETLEEIRHMDDQRLAELLDTIMDRAKYKTEENIVETLREFLG